MPPAPRPARALGSRAPVDATIRRARWSTSSAQASASLAGSVIGHGRGSGWSCRARAAARVCLARGGPSSNLTAGTRPPLEAEHAHE